MKQRLQGSKSSKQLAAAWNMLERMHKQYTVYRVVVESTSNTAEKPLKVPLCYSAMCDVWGDLEGMDTDAFFSSDAASNGVQEVSRW
ncbi:hypothetical protein PR003_g22503 [Phytophthora rubi]|uniref:Uncharacterized protein n=1 Tax=Phytophthora rubi TaxID=129364 RepID=A0A6A3MHD7_9STRA|nr:hypothetical protein PR002_g21834 [Phytophthora rubi]KAE9028865.1 hypothetical protein PR001_g11639 [Phytophthora rubi]KAE9301498.1 hypothetical protein PR003_g22503 [Phytophthora rubi]